jgi:glycine cleavage system transcriptional repressor
LSLTHLEIFSKTMSLNRTPLSSDDASTDVPMTIGTTQRYLITSAGQDKPGIVAGLTKVVMAHEGNILDAAMEVLSGFFCTLLLVSVPLSHVGALRESLQEASQALGQAVHMMPMESEESAPLGVPQASAHLQQHPLRFMIHVSGKDRTGITYHVAEALRQLGISIVDLSARQLTTYQNTPVYLMALEVILPEEAPETLPDTLQQTLEALAHRIAVDIRMEEVPLTFCG